MSVQVTFTVSADRFQTAVAELTSVATVELIDVLIGDEVTHFDLPIPLRSLEMVVEHFQKEDQP